MSSPIGSAAERPADGRPGRESFWLAAALVLTLAHLTWIGLHLAPAIQSPDANGYVVQARLIAEQGRTFFSTDSPVQYVGMHWLETADGVFHSRYPAGLPLLQALAWKFGGFAAALWVNPLFASATVLLTFLLARRFVAGGYACLAAAVVATVSVTNQHALDADAHVVTAGFLVAGILALLRFGETRGRLCGVVAGLLLGTVPAIRYPEAIVGAAIAGWLLWRVRPAWQAWPAVLGALVPLSLLGAHNAAAYGAFWRTGYALTNEQTGFGAGYFLSHLVPYLEALSGQGLSLMFAFGAAGLAALAAGRTHRQEGWLFAGIVVPLVLLYMAYYFGGGGPGGAGGNLRFLIPTFPFLAIAGVWLLAEIGGHLGRAGLTAVAVVATLQLILALGSSIPALATAKRSLAGAARVRTAVEKEIPAGSVLIVDRQFAESLDAVGRWKLVEESMVAGVGRGGPLGFPGPGMFAGRPEGGRGEGFRPPEGAPEGRGFEMTEDAPSPMQRGKNRTQRERYANLRPAERTTRVWADVRAWAGGRPVYWLTRSLDAIDSALPAQANYRTLTEIEAPMMGGPGGGAAGPGGRGGPPGFGMREGTMGPGRMMGGNSGPGRGFGGVGFAGAGGDQPGFGGPGGLPGARLGNNGGAGLRLRLVRIAWSKE